MKGQPLHFFSGEIMDTLIGLKLKDWFTLYRQNFFHLPISQYPNCLKLTILSIRNSIYARKEVEQFGHQIEQTAIENPPIFILGHWRSGTTLLHKLMSLDPQFAYPNVYEVYNPWTFLITEQLIKDRLEKLSAEKRPMDNVVISYKDPAEDEFALSLMSLKSPLIGWAFPLQEFYFDRYLTMHQITEEERQEWKYYFIYFLKKLTLLHNKQLVLKSPHHTARVKTLTEVFPDAKFVHIIRDPYRTFQSTLNLYRNTVAKLSMQKRDENKDVEAIIHRYKIMYDFYLEERRLIKPGNLIEIRFEDLEKDFLNGVAEIYEQLKLEGWDQFEPILKKYLESQSSYRKNVYPELEDSLKQKINSAWRKTFEEWGYNFK
ncbi:MAG: sulfotransferase [Bacteroidetes bacterium]|nr:MAG: sulfotransferase [Bacteroidota bacterium]